MSLCPRHPVTPPEYRFLGMFLGSGHGIGCLGIISQGFDHQSPKWNGWFHPLITAILRINRFEPSLWGQDQPKYAQVTRKIASSSPKKTWMKISRTNLWVSPLIIYLMVVPPIRNIFLKVDVRVETNKIETATCIHITSLGWWPLRLMFGIPQ